MMKSMASSMNIKPQAVKTMFDNESNVQKFKIVCFSLAMAASSSWFQSYFDNLVYRSEQFQMRALAGDSDWYGEMKFANYFEKLDANGVWSEDSVNSPFGKLWDLENTLEALKQVDKKDIKYIEKNWVNGRWERRNWDNNAGFIDSAPSAAVPSFTQALKPFADDTKVTEYYGPNGPDN